MDKNYLIWRNYKSLGNLFCLEKKSLHSGCGVARKKNWGMAKYLIILC